MMDESKMEKRDGDQGERVEKEMGVRQVTTATVLAGILLLRSNSHCFRRPE